MEVPTLPIQRVIRYTTPPRVPRESICPMAPRGARRAIRMDRTDDNSSASTRLALSFGVFRETVTVVNTINTN